MGTSHHLSQNFSKPFGIKYLGKDTKEHFAWQTSWGISWRLIGGLIMVHGDDRGLIHAATGRANTSSNSAHTQGQERQDGQGKGKGIRI